MKLMPVLLAAILSTTTLVGCSRELGSSTYTGSSVAGKVLEGTIVSARPVTVKDSEKLQDNLGGILAGGALGGIAGNSAGKGTGNALATVGGALAGAAVGAYAQDQLSISDGFEYIIRLDPEYISDSVVKEKKVTIDVNRKDSVEQDLKDAITTGKSKTKLVSVVQGRDTALKAGQKVFIIYSDDRPRVVAAQ